MGFDVQKPPSLNRLEGSNCTIITWVVVLQQLLFHRLMVLEQQTLFHRLWCSNQPSLLHRWGWSNKHVLIWVLMFNPPVITQVRRIKLHNRYTGCGVQPSACVWLPDKQYSSRILSIWEHLNDLFYSYLCVYAPVRCERSIEWCKPHYICTRCHI